MGKQPKQRSGKEGKGPDSGQGGEQSKENGCSYFTKKPEMKFAPQHGGNNSQQVTFSTVKEAIIYEIVITFDEAAYVNTSL
jgi:hypothetical protein